MPEFDNFRFPNSTELGINGTEWIHNSISQVDTTLNSSCQSNQHALLSLTSYENGFYSHANSFSTTKPSSTARRMTKQICNLFRTHHFLPWQENVCPSQVFTHCSVAGSKKLPCEISTMSSGGKICEELLCSSSI